MNHSELSHMAGAADDSTINIVEVIIIIIIIPPQSPLSSLSLPPYSDGSYVIVLEGCARFDDCAYFSFFLS